MSIVIAGAPAGQPFPTIWQAGATYLGYSNILELSDAVVVATSEEVGQEAANLVSWNGAQQWRSTAGLTQTITVSLTAAVDCNSWGVYRHNFADVAGTNINVLAEYSTDGDTWTTLGTQITPTANDHSTIYQIHSATVSASYFRVTVSNVDAGEKIAAAHLFFGESLLLYGSPDTGWTPPALAFEDRFVGSVSDRGNFIGRSLIRQAMRTRFNITAVESSWVYDNWQTLLDEVQKHPFYFSWDSVNHATDVAFCWTDGQLTKPAFMAPNHLTVGLSFNAVVNRVL